MRTENGTWAALFEPSTFQDAGFSIGYYKNDMVEFDECVMAYNESGINFSVGDTVEVDGEHVVVIGNETSRFMRVITPTGAPGARLATVSFGNPYEYGTGFIMISFGPRTSSTVRAEDVVLPGYLLEAQSGSRVLRVNNTPTSPVGMATTSKLGTGAPARVQVLRA